WRFIADGGRRPDRARRLRAVYRQLDARLAEVIAAAPRDAAIIVLSDHGFGSHTGRLFPNALLRRWGYLDWHGPRPARVRRSVTRHPARVGLARHERRPEAAWGVQVREHSFGRVLPLVWRRTRAYVAVAEICGFLFLNLRGREPEGVVSPGAEAEALADELRARLLDVRDQRDGAPVFARVERGADVYPDDRLGRRPALVPVPPPGYTLYPQPPPRL